MKPRMKSRKPVKRAASIDNRRRRMTTKPDEAAKKPEPEHGESVTYQPPPDEAQTVEWHGISFAAGKPQKVTDADMLAAARANPFFKVGGK
jgi:hypothetical protein